MAVSGLVVSVIAAERSKTLVDRAPVKRLADDGIECLAYPIIETDRPHWCTRSRSHNSFIRLNCSYMRC